MIPLPVVPLKGLTVLITRPQEQAESLGKRVEALGGTPILLPAVAIEGIAPPNTDTEFDWVIFVSTNSVVHGLSSIKIGDRTRVAAIGKTTASALESREILPDAVPEHGVTSEALLNHPAFATVSGQKVLIVKGLGGREFLHDELLARGAEVATLDVYRRTCPQPTHAVIDDVLRRWREDRVDVVTLTSVDILDNLIAMLGEGPGLDLLRGTAFVAASERIATVARERGLAGACLLARGADDQAIIGAIAAWHARAR